MRRETANIMLVLLGGALLKIAFNGDYLRYVKPSLLPFLLASGAVIVALGLLAILRDIRAARHDGPGVRSGDHEHGGRSPWLLVLPVLAIFLVAPPALGADTVSRSAQAIGSQQRAAQASDGLDFDSLPDGAVPAVPMGDFVARAVWDDSGSLDGRQVWLTGFIVHGPASPYLARLRIACCAADAVAVKVRLDASGAAARTLATAPENSWFSVRGEAVPGSATPGNHFVPTFTVSALRPVAPPEQPYEY